LLRSSRTDGKRTGTSLLLRSSTTDGKRTGTSL